ncbi:MAG: hypothetical protein COA52_03690 [Hyphomicrobiales bacterium]|nr:EAL domain-containing protein [Hyphomicrobiales bacterium]PCJ95580.1 MAG: hypothetical protein COA52_03690 [Hyphomicrobiales bacterium]
MRNKWVAVCGVILAFVPVMGAPFILGLYRDSEISKVTNELVEVFQEQVSEVIQEAHNTLSSFNATSLGPCNAIAVTTMQQHIFGRIYVEDLLVTDAAGNVLCAASGNAQAFRARGHPVTSDRPGFALQAVQMSSAQFEGLIISREISPGRHLNALVLSNVLLSSRGARDALHNGLVLLSLVGGIDVGRFPSSRLGAPIPSATDTMRIKDVSLKPLPLTIRLTLSENTLISITQIPTMLVYALASLLTSVGLFLVFYMLVGSRTPLGDLEEGLLNGEILAYYQPIIDLKNGNIVGCEALVRWLKPDGTVIPPAQFLQQADNSGLAIPLTIVLMRRIRDDLEDLYANRPDLKVAINLFPVHLNRLETSEEIEKIFGPSGIAFEQLTFEITERQPLEDLDKAKQIIQDLKWLGCSVALDDVGTGHNGLQYLMELGVDIVKIDKLFVDGISQGGFSETIIEALVRVAQNMRMKIVAEGIEHSRQAVALREMQIDFAQGYLFSKPLPAGAYIRLAEAGLKRSLVEATSRPAEQGASLPIGALGKNVTQLHRS